MSADLTLAINVTVIVSCLPLWCDVIIVHIILAKLTNKSNKDIVLAHVYLSGEIKTTKSYIFSCYKLNFLLLNVGTSYTMQPLISPINHESRHSSYHLNEEAEEPSAAEDTPLLQRFPPLLRTPSSPLTTFIVTFLLIILVSGVVIGIYLLILQNKAENVLPPVEMPLQYVSRLQWDGGASPVLSMSPHKASKVIVVHTDSDTCYTVDTCSQLLRSMENQTDGSQIPLPYNFLISSNGQMYEALGWRRVSPLFPQHSSSALILAFIGDFSKSPPAPAQLAEANNFFAESISRQHLSPSYIIFGRKTKQLPKYLYSSMQTLPQWRNDLTD
ncbi:hypothetical protein evm_004334 [Chilo suppressalis]|nr:hypothetical protein evm_004334 [Chilo suppressalis]